MTLMISDSVRGWRLNLKWHAIKVKEYPQIQADTR